MKYLKLFSSHSDYDAAKNSLDKPNVSHCIQENEVHYNPLPHDYSKDYLTFKILSDGDIIWKTWRSGTSQLLPKTISYKINNGEWTSITSSAEGTSFSVNKGDKVLFKGNNNSYGDATYFFNGFGTSTATFNIEGNIMSLIGNDNFEELDELTEDKTFIGLFSLFNSPNLSVISVKNLILPATSLSLSCYYLMFSGCSNLIDTPELPATTLSEDCYGFMFENCISLVTAPELPATTLADYCYEAMFQNCTGLTEPPELPVLTLTPSCYQYMFWGCTSLTTAPELPATTLANYCYYSMFGSCNLTSAPELPATTLANSCYEYMFSNCTSLVTAPELSATTLTQKCYGNMFEDCTSLTTAPELPATTLASSCYYQMFKGCTSLITAPELPATTLTESCYYCMFYGTNVLPDTNNIDFESEQVVTSGGLRGLFGGTNINNNDLLRIFPKDENDNAILPVTTLASYCYSTMFYNCTNLTVAPILPATTLASYCYSGMFNGCTNLTTAPILPAITLISNCYNRMFYGCSSLNYIKAMFTTTPSSSYTNNWVNGVSATGTFVKNSAANWTTSGVNGVPSGWTVQTASE